MVDSKLAGTVKDLSNFDHVIEVGRLRPGEQNALVDLMSM